jgi:geranylgeranyl pyrophosphate synthase
MNSSERVKLQALHTKKLSQKEAEWIKAKMHEYGIIQKSFAEAKTLAQEAIALMNEKGESALSGIAMAMIERDF